MSRLHPSLAEVHRQKIADLTAALDDDQLRTKTTETLRSLIEEIKLISQEDRLMLALVEALAGILALGQSKRPHAGAWGCSTKLVAGACNQRYLPKLPSVILLARPRREITYHGDDHVLAFKHLNAGGLPRPGAHGVADHIIGRSLPSDLR